MSDKMQSIYSTQIKPEWIDYNNHMNVAYYVLVFDKAGEKLVSDIGLSETFTKKTGISWMVLESHITYSNEVMVDQTVEVRCQLLDHDSKRLHLYFEMYAYKDDGSEYLASTLEQLVMCVDLNVRKSRPFPDSVANNIKRIADEQSDTFRPENIGRTIGIQRQ